MKRIKYLLDRFYKEYNSEDRILHDPIEFPYKYKRVEDIEVVGFISSCFAYGRVGLFKTIIEKIFSKMGSSPYDFLYDFNVKRHARLFSGIKYRFNENSDIICLFFVMSGLLKRDKSIEEAFKRFYRTGDRNIGNALGEFTANILNSDTFKVYGKNIKPSGFLQFFPSPINGSACKRMNLFLRWMIRDKDIDFGIWHGIPKNKLIIPLDTHISRISKCLGFTRRKTQDWKMAVEITEALKKLDPEDPLKYDFAMCHYGISGFCGHNPSPPPFSKGGMGGFSGRNAKCDKCILRI